VQPLVETWLPSQLTTEIVLKTPTILPSPTELPSVTTGLTNTPSTTATHQPTSTPTKTMPPPELPEFTSKALREGVMPQMYITDPCVFLYHRWSVDASLPGTVVIPIMFHGIRKSGGSIDDNVTISEEDFAGFVSYAEYLGYETITTDQLERFLLFNERIPPLSMLWIVDDRRPGTIEDHILPVLERNNWTVTLGWVSGDNNPEIWQWMETLYASGRLDVQSHGYEHRYMVWDTPEEVIREEIALPIPLIEEHFGKKPVAFIWPGGNFTPLAVKIAREEGYHLGFTIQSRGPIMYNWIPLGEEEQAIQDPFMVLPRFWSTALGVSLDIGMQISLQAREDAISRYDDEATYFRQYCGGELPGLAEFFPPSSIP
jgi:peptidoglycan/xylan/chitin deacetylase (PgdA/CDA1 family)